MIAAHCHSRGELLPEITDPTHLLSGSHDRAGSWDFVLDPWALHITLIKVFYINNVWDLNLLKASAMVKLSLTKVAVTATGGNGFSSAPVIYG